MKGTKEKRIKRVFSSAEPVLHLWANQAQNNARYSGINRETGYKCDRVYFEGNRVWSYGSHYELGRIVEYRGVKVGVVNSTKYSNTTSGYQSSAYRALDGLMPRLQASTFDVFEALLENQTKLIDELMGHFSQRSFWREKRWDANADYGIEFDIREFNKTARALKHPELCIEVTKDFIDLYNEHVQRMLKRAEELKGPEYEAKRELARLKRIEAAKRKAEKEIENWQNGYDYNRKTIQDLSPQLIRVIGNTVQTSRGAKVPLNEALTLLRAVERGKAKLGDTIGAFTFQRVDGNDIVRIGCHTFELEHAKKVLGSKQFQLVQGGKQ